MGVLCDMGEGKGVCSSFVLGLGLSGICGCCQGKDSIWQCVAFLKRAAMAFGLLEGRGSFLRYCLLYIRLLIEINSLIPRFHGVS